jgi:thymidylate synthase
MEIEVVYKNDWLLKMVDSEVAKVRHLITRSDKLETLIIKSLTEYILKDANNINHKRYLGRIIAQKISEAKKKYGTQKVIFLADLSQDDDEGHAIEYEPVDVLANVDSALEIKETITLLAKDDRRRELILNAWANGITNDTELSDTLAGVLGGQSRSHCKFIQRFRIECRSVLTAAI